MKIFLQYQIIKDLPQPVCRNLCTDSIFRISIHLILPDLRRRCTTQSIQDHGHPVSLTTAFHAPDHCPGLLAHILLFKLGLAVQAVSAVAFSVFPKIFQDVLTQTIMGKAVKGHLLQPLLITLPDKAPGCRLHFLVILSSLDKILISNHILPTVKQDTFRRIAVTARTACFLIIAFHVLRHIIMNDITHIRLVDSHSKCIGGYHHTTAVINKIILIVPAFLIGKSCMISGGRDAVTDQLSADFLHQLSGKTVDDSTVVRMLQYVIVYFLIFIFRCFHCKIKVFPVKSCGCAKGILKPQKSCNILPNLLRGCSCKCTDHRSFWKLCHKLCDLQIAWPKILSPL